MTNATAVAADDKQNQFSLVYRGAITKNEPDEVNIHPLTYKLTGLDIVANVYTPARHDSRQTYPAVVVAHPNGGVKEQTAGLYAQHLASKSGGGTKSRSELVKKDQPDGCRATRGRNRMAASSRAVWFEPSERHWHGASPTTAMTHVAIAEMLDGKVVARMEQVTDEQYGR